MEQQPELDLSEIVAAVIATTVASGLMAAAGLAEASAQMPEAKDTGASAQPDHESVAEAVSPR